ncbi:unnamed protein product [Litomosoides sigmodontis]|uniref:SRR1-like domain-containing protein n=1 Tax=Litomosoides sigmodontis TaxID=42156 RepID=A0A3P6TIM5_LITSI|nr:unnamed protein product [Litomosoides sigmodontis]
MGTPLRDTQRPNANTVQMPNAYAHRRQEPKSNADAIRQLRKKVLRRFRRRGEKVTTIIPYPVDEVPVERIDMIMKNACTNSEVIQYSQQIIALLLKSLSGRQLSCIWALGLGSFSHSYCPGCDQLAVLLQLKYHFGCEVYFQEPCSTRTEKRWLCDHSICLSETSDLLECRVSDDDDDINNGSVVLFYALHCGHAIYNSVIYAHRKKLKRIIIAVSGNNLHLMDLAARQLEKREDSVGSAEKSGVKKCNTTDLETTDCNELEALSSYSKVCTMVNFPVFKPNFAIFNDTALHFLPQNAPLPEISETKPNYELFDQEVVIEIS